eukprot:3547721-Prymnesium_polylepis.1
MCGQQEGAVSRALADPAMEIEKTEVESRRVVGRCRAFFEEVIDVPCAWRCQNHVRRMMGQRAGQRGQV